MILVILRCRVPRSFWEGPGGPLRGSRGGVSGPFWEPLGRLLGASWAVLGAFWAVLRTSWAVVGASWAVLGASRTVLEPLGPSLGCQKPPRGLQDTPRRLRDPPRTPSIRYVPGVFAHLHTFPRFPPSNGVQNGVQHGVQKWGPKIRSKMGSLILGGSPKWSLQDSFALTL